MKSTHEPFDRDLKGRLLEYAEEPDKDLWSGIVSRIVSLDAAPGWTVWTNRLSVLVIALSAVFFFTAEGETSPNETLAQVSPSYTVVDTMQVAPFLDKDEESISGNSVRRQITRSAGEGLEVEVHPTQFSRLVPEEQPPDQVHSIAAKGDLSLLENQHDILPSGTDLWEPATSIRPSGKPGVVNNSRKSSGRTSPQDEASPELPEKQRARKPFSLYFTAMPTFGYQRIQSNKEDDIKIHGIKSVPAFSADRLGVRLEAGAEVPLSKQWTVFGGFLYFQRKQTIDYIERELVWGEGNGPRSEYSYVSKSIEYELKNAGLQVGLTYRLWMASKNSTGRRPLSTSRKLSHVLGSGIEFHKALNKTQALERAENFTDPSTYVFFNVYYRMQYPSAGKLRAIFQPTFNYSFYINENLNAPFYVKPYGLGLNLGCTYNFR
ncbi:MAG: hypothetical protein WEB30_08540 [Cyclobacteriaceae bacterium]